MIPGAFVVSDTGIEPATSSVSGKRATAAPIAQTYFNEVNIAVFLVIRGGDGI